MAADIQEMPFVKQLAANGTYSSSLANFVCIASIKPSSLIEVLGGLKKIRTL